jgi:hypothetical protein
MLVTTGSAATLVDTRTCSTGEPLGPFGGKEHVAGAPDDEGRNLQFGQCRPDGGAG